MAIEGEILGHLVALLGGNEDIEAFEDWFVERSWDDDNELVRRITSVLAESSGASFDATKIAFAEFEDMVRRAFAFGSGSDRVEPSFRPGSENQNVTIGMTVRAEVGMSLRGNQVLLAG